jgi:hypothetical protein
MVAAQAAKMLIGMVLQNVKASGHVTKRYETSAPPRGDNILATFFPG